jgi:haloalkane dehalogenase
MTIRTNVLRTPDARFVGLPGYPFEPHYLEIADRRLGPMRMHYVDEGPKDAPVVLMLHGEPTWSYLYRKIIPRVTESGYRAVAPDYIGFGRSDKPVERASYTYENHLEWMRQFVDRLSLRRCTLLLQDWGGPIGLRLLAERPQCFDAVVLANTLLPNCEPPPRGIEDWPGPIVGPWAQSTRGARDFDVGLVIRSVCVGALEPAVVAAYDRVSRADPRRPRPAAHRDRARRALRAGGRQRGAHECAARSARATVRQAPAGGGTRAGAMLMVVPSGVN